MPIVTWDHVHLRSPDPEATAARLENILGGVIIRGPGRIDVKLGGANVFIAPVAAGDGANSSAGQPPTQGLDHFWTDREGYRRGGRRDQGQAGCRVHQGANDHPAGRSHLLHPRAAGYLDRTTLERDKKYA